ncbi:unnamed protein product [Symbiodinium sp. KB8]|nr:unnamed protein product [Symbiodinium sp. KB8]
MWMWKPQQVFGSILSTVWDSLAGSEYGFPSAQKGHRVVGMGVLHPYGSFGGPVEGQYNQTLFPKEKAWWMGRAATKGQAQRSSQRGQVRWQGQVGDTRHVPFGPPDRKLASSAVGNGTSTPEEGGGKQRRSSLAGEDATGHFGILACRGGDKCAGASEGSGGRTPAHCHIESDEGYIDQLTALLEAQLNDQEVALEKFNTAEIDWLASEREATIAIARMASKDQAISEEDQEMEDGEFRASEAAETEARLQKETEEHQSAGRNLHNALQVARQQAAEHLNKHQREGSRTPRRKNDVEPEGQQVDKAKEEATGKPSGGTATTPFKLGGSQAQAKSAPEVRCEAGQDASLTVTSAFLLAQVQCEHSLRPARPLTLQKPVLQFLWKQEGANATLLHGLGTLLVARPPFISDLQAMLASHVPLRPEWVSGPLLHMSPFEARWLATFLPAEQDRRRFTVFDCRLDLMSRASGPEWSLLDYITAAVRSVPYRVRLIWYIVRPIPDLPTPQFSVTAHDAPGGTRAVPVDLRGLGGMLHTIEVGPGPLRPLWAELRAKGVDPGSRLEQAWLEDLCEFRDEQGRHVDAITADGTSPEWLVLSLTDPLAPVHIEVDYVGGAGHVLRVPPPVPPPRGPCSTPASTSCTTTAVAVRPVTHHCQAVSPDEIAVLPEDLASPAERLLCMGAVPGLRYLLRERVPLQRHYTLFERAGNLHIRPLRPEWSLLDLVQDVMLVVPMLRSIQVLHSPLDRLPVLQVAATEMGWPTDSLAIPFDLRGAGLQICTLVVGPGLTQRILHEAVWTECAAGRSGVPDTVPFADSLGRTGDTRRPLADVQFFARVPGGMGE